MARLFLCSAGLFLSLVNGCDSGKEEPRKPAETSQSKGEKPKYSVPIAYRRAISNVLNSYFEVHEALASDDFEKAKTGSKTMIDSIEKSQKISVDELADNIRSVWNEDLKNLHSATAKIDSANDFQKLRSLFSATSTELIKTIRDFGHAMEKPVQVLYCGMAEANWLQRNSSELIRNPYFGKEMLG